MNEAVRNPRAPWCAAKRTHALICIDLNDFMSVLYYLILQVKSPKYYSVFNQLDTVDRICWYQTVYAGTSLDIGQS